jgi:exodeoxyribonuclease V gamma subunit
LGEVAGQDPRGSPRARFWATGTVAASGSWSGAGLRNRIISALRTARAFPEFRDVARYLGPGLAGAVSARELGFAGQVAQALERWMHDRPSEARAALGYGAPGDADEDAWLAALLRALHADALAGPSPLERFERFVALAPRLVDRTLRVFGLSTLRPGDKLRLQHLSAHLHVELYLMTPSREFLGDLDTPREAGRAQSRARDDSERRALAEAAGQRNPLLAANAAPSRDLQTWLLDLNADEGEVESPFEAAPTTVLAHLQRWLDAAADRPEAPEDWADPPGAPASMELHATHGALRQCEALRDALLRRFAFDPTLEPRHVLVMTPDLATYAPLVAAVFGRSSAEGAPAIPVHVADLGLRSTNPVAETLLLALSLAGERVTATRLTDLLDLEPIRERFGFDDADAADLRTLIVESGLRWGWDAEDRARHDQPAQDQNTLRFGLERLALGVLMPDAGGLRVLPESADAALGPAAPVEVQSATRAARVGRLLNLASALDRTRRDAQVPGTAIEWRERLTRALDALTAVPPQRAWQRLQVTEALGDLLVEGPLEYAAEAIVALLSGAFDVPQRGERPAGSAVTVCALEPMRSVPFRVIALVGMDDGAFPRAGATPAWDPMARRPKAGEYDRRTVDRHLFLEALLSARDALLVFYTGFEPKQGKSVPPSVVVVELQEALQATAGAGPAEPCKHPLQPWSPRIFESDRLRPFDPWTARAAAAQAHGVAPTRTESGLGTLRMDGPLPEPLVPQTDLSVERLARAAVSPQRVLLRDRLRLDLQPSGAAVQDREPLEADAYDDLDLARRIDVDLEALGLGAETVDVAALQRRLRAEGALAVRAQGEKLLGEALESVRRLHRLSDLEGAVRCGVRSFALRLDDGVTVRGACDDVRVDAGGDLVLVRRVYTRSVDPRSHMEFALLVALAALSRPDDAGRVVRRGVLLSAASDINRARLSLRAPDAHAGRALLTYAVALSRRAQVEAVPLFRRLSYALAQLTSSPPSPPSQQVTQALKAWDDGQGRGDSHDPWVAALFGGLTGNALAEPARAAQLVAEATAVWAPVLALTTEPGEEGA